MEWDGLIVSPRKPFYPPAAPTSVRQVASASNHPLPRCPAPESFTGVALAAAWDCKDIGTKRVEDYVVFPGRDDSHVPCPRIFYWGRPYTDANRCRGEASGLCRFQKPPPLPRCPAPESFTGVALAAARDCKDIGTKRVEDYGVFPGHGVCHVCCRPYMDAIRCRGRASAYETAIRN